MKPTCKQCSSPYHSKMSCKDNPVAVAKATATKKRMQLKAASKPKKPRAASKVKKIPKKKVVSRGQLVKRLDSVYSQYIRLKNADSEGYCICVTCGDRIHWKEIQNGHFISRAKYPTRWHDENCHPQCMRDNIFLRGRYIDYTLYMIDRYGRDRLQELRALSINGAKIPTPELREKIEYYRGKVAELLAK